jgi:ABC-2 type transport system permease protein
VLLLAVVASTLLVVAAERIAAGRDIGTGMLPARDTADPRLRLLSSPTAQALRGERGSLIVWLTGVGAFAYIIGVTANSTSSAGISKSLQRELAKLGSGSIVTPSGYLAFTFIFFVLAVSLFTCAQIAAARHVEADQQIEALLAQPVGRVRWLGGRLEAGANCLPVALLFLGIAALAYAVAPQASAGIAYGLVTIGFLWQLFGSLFGAPKWLVELTPFAHLGLVPAEPFRAGAAAVMVGIGLVVAVVALGVFRRRDLLGA